MHLHRKIAASVVCALTFAAPAVLCCTSAIIWGDATADGLSILWKNRDTSALDNYVERVVPADGGIPYVALFNASDTLMAEAWAGVNERGFAIINTASYNLQPDTAAYRDREGVVMSMALSRCRTLTDFEALLDTLPAPMGVTANFGVTDSEGSVAYYEVGDHSYVAYRGTDRDRGVMLRTNYSYSGDTITQGKGYIRHANAMHLIRPAADSSRITPRYLLDDVACSYYNALMQRDMASGGGDAWLADQDFIPRYSTSASVAIVSGDAQTPPYMLVALGYPPCAHPVKVTTDSVPDILRPLEANHTARASNDAMALKNTIFPLRRSNGCHYIFLPALKQILNKRNAL